MTNIQINASRLFFAFLIFGICGYSSELTKTSAEELADFYHLYATSPSDISEHLPPLRELASHCTSVAEIGIRSVVSTWALLKGLADAGGGNLSYLGIDLEDPPKETWEKAVSLAQGCGIAVQFWKNNDMYIDLPPVDMLFIDSLHTYCHLTYELEKFCPQVRKYIAMHDTSDPWGHQDDHAYGGNYSEYASWINRSKKGLWPAVLDFLYRHPEWTLAERRLNNHGFTVLKRI